MRLAVTRDKQRLASLTEQANLRKVQVVALPLLDYVPVAFEFPQDFDPTEIDWLFFTSANGVTAFLDRMKKLGLTLSGKTKISVVGKKTGEAVANSGLTVDFVPSENYGHIMFNEFAASYSGSNCTVLYARGEQVNFDPAQMFENTTVTYNSVVCYRAVPGEINNELVDNLGAGDYLLFTAPSTVSAYHTRFGLPRAKTIAIGRTTESEMKKFGWQAFAVMSEADIDKVWEYM